MPNYNYYIQYKVLLDMGWLCIVWFHLQNRIWWEPFAILWKATVVNIYQSIPYMLNRPGWEISTLMLESVGGSHMPNRLGRVRGRGVIVTVVWHWHPHRACATWAGVACHLSDFVIVVSCISHRRWLTSLNVWSMLLSDNSHNLDIMYERKGWLCRRSFSFTSE